MKHFSTDEDRETLLGLGIPSDLLDTPAGARLIRVIFGDAEGAEEFDRLHAGEDRGFACCD
ncbi:MAG: hypothetical protein K1X78_09765 [Verrucomicrobiaceae bacterium]|nr:hypothetical protein [Verrucomicrobiaceae bacterium]